MVKHAVFRVALAAAAALGASSALAQNYPSAPQIFKDGTRVGLVDYAIAPKTGSGSTAQVARINFLRQEPAGSPLASSRVFVNDLSGTLYTLNRTTKTFSPYLSFPANFSAFDSSPGLAAGAVTFAFDPDYATSGPNLGKFYTTHTEVDPALGSASAYRVAVVTAWQDTSILDGTFTGTRREMMRVTYGASLHPLGDIVFNPNALPGSSDYRNMYIASGDGGAGERPADRGLPQNPNNFLGKVLRISPDDPDGAGPLAYGIPSDNPFVSTPGARGEVWATGFRNPHRMSWDAQSDTLMVNDIGLNKWEEVNIIKKGGNYGYADREGGALFNSNTGVSPTENLGYTYPVLEYSHRDGDAVTSGFVYRGSNIPYLVGKYVFGDITTGRLFYADLAEMIAADDGAPLTFASIRELQVEYNGSDARVIDIVRDRFDLRNDGLNDNDALTGTAPVTNGNDPYGVPYGGGRVDIRWAMDGAGELYLISKSDGMIRALVAVPEPGTAVVVVAASFGMRRRRRCS